uniref:acyl-CoA-binding domain-containing protein 6 n=1 Tax=Doryrhamphus excisus TaxID=161450 RepID=UPI0025AE80BA|nr:acyl-CoA-binding domain-containing protein 6 [Doryrhamphus excisus]
MSDVSEESLLDYFYSTAGSSARVRNADILKTFKPFIGHNDPQLRAKYREEFKLIIDRIAVVKSENGEKYLFLKKKYRQLLQARDNQDKLPRQDEDERRCPGPGSAPATEQPRRRQDELMAHNEPDGAEEWESEQDDDSTGSMGSAAVALDPIEKEWIYFAAGARVPDLCQLLRQDPSLANKKDFTSFTALHWAAKHGNEDMAALVANAGADVNTKSGYTPLHIAALHGHCNILHLLVGTYGAKENLRDYSGHLALHYLKPKEAECPEEDCELPADFQVSQARERNRNRKLASLFQSKKKWGSAEELAPIEEERAAPHQLALPAFRPRKFSR